MSHGPNQFNPVLLAGTRRQWLATYRGTDRRRRNRVALASEATGHRRKGCPGRNRRSRSQRRAQRNHRNRRDGRDWRYRRNHGYRRSCRYRSGQRHRNTSHVGEWGAGEARGRGGCPTDGACRRLDACVAVGRPGCGLNCGAQRKCNSAQPSPGNNHSDAAPAKDRHRRGSPHSCSDIPRTKVVG
jgi:hypothetical protein